MRSRSSIGIFTRTIAGFALLMVLYHYLYLDRVDIDLPDLYFRRSFWVVSVGWLIASILTFQYSRSLTRSFKELTNPYAKGYGIMIVIVFVFIGTSPNLFKTLLIFAALETLLNLSIWMFGRRGNRVTGPQEEIEDILKERQQGHLHVPEIELATDIDITRTLRQLEEGDVKPPVWLTDGAEQINVTGPRIKCIKTQEDIDGSGFLLLASTIPLNELKYLNRYLKSVYDALAVGGFAIFRYEPLEFRKERVRARRLDFLVHRALPRLPVLEWLYPLFTRGRNRALSRAEVWGRSQYCGFDVVHEEESQGACLILVRKLYEPSLVANPSHYPVIKLDRMGLGGEVKKIHKVRTMHPYSEFIQKKVFEMYDLSSTGKFKEDFRITGWGKVLRRYWLDELPQLLDWLQGNIKIVGIRAMSLHYFSLYPRRYQDKYCRVKPGFLSPIFDEGTASFDDIVATEERYLDAYLENPLRADLHYFRSTLSDIMFKGTRSG